ncbi:MAG: DUF2306 domain-containing protein [Bacteroidota bacterium]
MKKNLLLLFLLIGALSMLLMSTHYFTVENSGILARKALKDTLWYKASFLMHIAGGLIAIALGPFMFINKLLIWKVHRPLGTIYAIAVLISSIAGLLIAQFAMGGLATRLGFSLLALVWGYSLVLSLMKIRQGEVKSHQMWMRINYALTFAAITQRTMLLFAFIPSISFIVVYQLSAWLPWLFNVGLVLIVLQRKSKKQFLN